MVSPDHSSLHRKNEALTIFKLPRFRYSVTVTQMDSLMVLCVGESVSNLSEQLKERIISALGLKRCSVHG